MVDNKTHSFKKFSKNKAALAGLIFIALITFLAILGYLIVPDGSPMANKMNLPLSVKKPGSSFKILSIPKNDIPEKVNILQKMWFGEPEKTESVVITGYKITSNIVIYREYIGQGEKGELYKLPLKKFGSNITPSAFESDYITTKTFWLGSDIYGRDLLSRLIIGARVSLTVGLMAVLISLILGVSLGAIAGYYSGIIDKWISWLMNVLWSLPALLLVIAISFALGKGFWQVFIAVGLSMWVEVARLVRGQIISIKNAEFIEAAKALGYRNSRIIIKHILPNIAGPILVVAAANFASAILLEAGLSFLGFGAQPPMPTWGAMIKEHYGYIIIDAAYLAIIPGAMIMLVVYAFNLITLGLRDFFDIRSQNTNV